MSKDPKVTTETIAPAEVYKRLGPISRAASAARHELGELPITYVESRGEKTLALVPPWAAQWMERHAAEMLASIQAEDAAS
ncbi:hypothetical protein [Actinocrinis sp.]|uniref:hypothetical protein n=1 Tax=Actinocrinis sp. TaxID=1920516 RepID=UPI002D29AEBF|nr:hypothetical protein [Actinocrinis sp.]HZP54989.1 hypothetical protein [Actinocrinis sp.]